MLAHRKFLRFLGGAAASGPVLAKATIDDLVLKQAGFPMSNAIGVAAPQLPARVSEGAVARMVRWVRRAGIPAWKMNDLRRQADYARQFGLDPDLAALRSVSGGWKAREQRRRNLERAIEFSLASIGRNSARRSFEDKVQAKFGEHVEWYD